VRGLETRWPLRAAPCDRARELSLWPKVTGKQDMAWNQSPRNTPTASHARLLEEGWGHMGRIFRHAQCIILLVLAAFMGCAPLRPLPPGKPISQDQARHLISRMRAQADGVFSFLGIGRLLFREGDGETEMNLLAVGQRPSRVRLEITHTWGKPLLYMVVDRGNTSVLSFVEHTFYSGPSSQLDTRRFFPFELGLDAAWVLLAGRIPILPHCTVESLRPNELTLFNGQGEAVERLTFSSGLSLPGSIHLPRQGFTVGLSHFKEGTPGPYPSRITIAQGDERQLEIRYTSLRVNSPIPEEIFRLNPPPDVEIIQQGYREH
jgi:hypothetical protein